MTWTKIINTTADWAKTEMDFHGVWFIDPWFSNWFVPMSDLMEGWTKIPNTTGGWIKLR